MVKKKETDKKNSGIGKLDLLKVVKEVLPLVPGIVEGLKILQSQKGTTDKEDDGDSSGLSLLCRIERLRSQVRAVEGELVSIASDLRE